jgi:hypothetical protein
MTLRAGARPHRVIVHRRGQTGTDRYNKPVYGYVPDAAAIKVRVDPTATDEVLGDRETVTRRYLIVLGAEASPPAPGDRLEWLDEAKLIELDGDVMPLYDARRLHHYEAEGVVVSG